MPDDPAAWGNRGELLWRLERYDESLEALDRAIQLDPDLADAWYNRGEALKAQGRDEEADVAYARAKELGYSS
jgi:tetratricopeptide (TPR) repeat protein